MSRGSDRVALLTAYAPKPCTYRPTNREITDLIVRAEQHELGTDFLTQGSLDAVAATFGVHAFVVDEARDRLITEL